MGEQAELSLDDALLDDRAFAEKPQWKECFICGEKYLDDGESGCCNIDS